MEALIQFAHESREIRELTEAAVEHPPVQGVVIDVDDVWLALWYLGQLGDRDFTRTCEALAAYGRLRQGNAPYYLGRTGELPHWVLSYLLWGNEQLSGVPAAPLDLGWEPPYWSEIRQLSGSFEGPPVVVKVCLRPPYEGRPADLPVLPPSTLRVMFEVRPVASLSRLPSVLSAIFGNRARRPAIVEGGVAVQAGGPGSGTLGGVVEDSIGARYGVSCSHVCADGADVRMGRDGAGRVIGTVYHRSDLRRRPRGEDCNPWAEMTTNEIDVALIRLTARSEVAVVRDLGRVEALAGRSRLVPRQTVHFQGATSGAVERRIGGLALTYEFRVGEDDDDMAGGRTAWACFRNLFEVRAPSRRDRSSVQGGDSGAWVLSPGPSGHEWAGIVIGNDSLMGYAAFAETAVTWMQDAGVTLRRPSQR
jgi:hypothetical protein